MFCEQCLFHVHVFDLVKSLKVEDWGGWVDPHISCTMQCISDPFSGSRVFAQFFLPIRNDISILWRKMTDNQRSMSGPSVKCLSWSRGQKSNMLCLSAFYMCCVPPAYNATVLLIHTCSRARDGVIQLGNPTRISRSVVTKCQCSIFCFYLFQSGRSWIAPEWERD